MRTSFGLLGLVYEVTFKVKPLKPMAFHHESFTVDEFERQLPALRARGESMMYYLFPFQDQIAVEFRKYVDDGQPASSFAWKMRNLSWGTVVPGLSAAIRKSIPTPERRYALYEGLGTFSRLLLGVIRAEHTYPADQMIRYPDTAGADPLYFQHLGLSGGELCASLRGYFAFCRDYYRTTRLSLRHVECRLPDQSGPKLPLLLHLERHRHDSRSGLHRRPGLARVPRCL